MVDPAAPSPGAARRAWNLRNPGNAEARRELSALMLARTREAIDGGGRILDVGCGTGWWLETLATTGVDERRLYGLDADPGRVDQARKRVPGASILAGDARSLPFEADRFALVTCVLLLSSLRPGNTVTQAIDEMWRVLRPGGQLVCYEFRIRKPFGESTRLVRTREIDARFGAASSRATATVLPPLARRLGRFTGPLYARLARIPAATTHVVTMHRKGAPPQ